MDCVRCGRPYPEVNLSKAVTWETAYDAQGKAVGFVCPGCLTQEDQRIDEIKEALLDEEDEEMLRREHAADDEEEF